MCWVLFNINKKIPGIYDIRDLYDLLAFKYLTVFPRSILSIDDETNVSSSECLDIYGMPTRKFDGIQSCLVQYLYDSTKEKDHVFKYSGPLLYGNLEWIPEDFLSSINTFVHYKVNKTLPKYCKYDVRDGTMYAFTCVCHGDDQEMCRKPLNKRMCAYNFINKSKDVYESAEILFREKCEYLFITRSSKSDNTSMNPKMQYEIILGDSSKYIKDCNVYRVSKWCSLIDVRTNFNEAYKACCNETDFCNAIKVNDLVNSEYYLDDFECMYASKMIAMAFKYCERYLDLLSNKTVVLNSFIYYELKKCKCYENNCDENGKPMEFEMRNFAFPDKLSCQSANYSTSEYEMFEKEISLLYDSWTGSLGATCFIEISLKNKIYHIEAKAITDKSTIPKVCLTFPFSPDSYFQSSPGRIRCCTAVLEQPQSKSNCTIEFMKNEFQKQLKTENAIQQLIGQKGTLKCGKNDCLISDGCYETKEITIVPEENEEITVGICKDFMVSLFIVSDFIKMCKQY
uniref:Uncharacterized protein n=1 Tax=Panagrolaimus superbus TaxID=310955 RepID=A0A914Z5Z8_9BILA